MLSLLPYELILEISDNFDIFTILSTISVNKKYRRFLLIKKIRLMSNIKKIQKLYKNNLPRFPPTALIVGVAVEVARGGRPAFYIHGSNLDLKKTLIVRIYIASYPMRYLMGYPEDLIKKTRNGHPSDETAALKNYVNRKLPKKDKRTRRDIRDFLNQSIITLQDIIHTGW